MKPDETKIIIIWGFIHDKDAKNDLSLVVTYVELHKYIHMMSVSIYSTSVHLAQPSLVLCYHPCLFLVTTRG